MKIVIEGTSEELANVLRKLVNGNTGCNTMNAGTESVVLCDSNTRQNAASDTICYAR